MTAKPPGNEAPESRLLLLRKASELLQLLGTEGELTPAQAAEGVGEPRSSLYRLLAVLQELEWVEVGSRKGTFRLGTGLLRLGGMVAQGLDVRQFALPEMQALLELSGQTVFLTVPRGTDAVCVERLPGKRVQVLALTLGGSLPLHMGGGPRALLAAEPRDFWAEYLRLMAARPGQSGDIPTAEQLFPLLEEVRRDGISVSDGDVTPGIAALGVPIRDYRGGPTAALSVSGLREDILGSGSAELRQRLIAAGATVSKALGYEPGVAIAVDFG